MAKEAEEKFDFVFDRMTSAYNGLDQIMGDLYRKVKENPNDTESLSLLQRLSEVAEMMISSQVEYTDSFGYGPRSDVDTTIDRLQAKKQAVHSSVAELSDAHSLDGYHSVL